MLDEYDRSRIAVDRALIQQAAVELRQGAIRAGYAVLERKHFAFALAPVLDELARHWRDHWRDLDEQLRVGVLDGCRALLGDPTGR